MSSVLRAWHEPIKQKTVIHILAGHDLADVPVAGIDADDVIAALARMPGSPERTRVIAPLVQALGDAGRHLQIDF